MKENNIIAPSLEEIKQGVDQLILIENWNRYKVLKNPEKFYNRVEKVLLSKLKILPTVFEFHESNIFPFKFYRVRKEEKRFNNSLISEYSHPPAYISNYIQRANLPYHPVFYCSDNPATAIAEAVKNVDKINPKDIYYLSEWEFKPDIKFILSPFIFGNLNENSFYKFWSESNLIKLKKTLEDEGASEAFDSFSEIFRFLSNLFVYENSYVVSSVLAHGHLYANHNLRSDLFVYPSVQLDRSSVNYAIHPNAVSEKLKLNKVFKMKFDEIDKNSGIKFQIINFGQNINSVIMWNSKFEDNISLINKVFPDFKIR